MHYWLTFGRYLCANIHVILEGWVHKGSNLTLEKVGGGINPATDVTHFGFFFFLCSFCYSLSYYILNYEAESQLSLRWIMHQNVLLRMKIMLYFHQRILDLIYRMHAYTVIQQKPTGMFICLDWSACVCSHSKQNSLQYLPMHHCNCILWFKIQILNMLDMNNGKLVKCSPPLTACFDD